MKFIYCIILTLCLTLSSLAKKNEIDENIDVTHYEIHLTSLDFSNRTLEATTIVTLTTKNTTDVIYLELKSLNVTEISSNEVNINNFSQDNDILQINLSSELQENSQASFTIKYCGNTFNESWGGIHWSNEYVYNLGVGFDSQPHNLGKTWFPCVDDFVDKASYEIFITIPEDMTSSCGGTLDETTYNNDGTKTDHWSVNQEIPTYLISFAAGYFSVWEDTYNGIEKDIPINVFAKPNQIDKVEATFANIKEIAAFFEEKFGPYPFNRIGYVSTSLGCMEHIDNIAYSSSLITGTTNLDSESFIAHELSHMWFGNLCTCSTAGDMWLNEGFATFCEAYYLTELYGENYYNDYMKNLINTITLSCHQSEGWIPLNNMPLNLTYGTTVYDKGATVVHSLMNYLGREKFDNAIRHYLSEFSYKSASSEELRDVLSNFTGVDMTDFFNTWVFTPGSPNYSITNFSVEPNGNYYDVNVVMKQKHRGAEHIGNNVVYDITFIDENWNIISDTVCWNGTIGSSTKTIDIEPVAILCDYNNKFADACSNETFIIKENGEYNFNIAKFKTIAETIADSTFLYVEHHWVGPESYNGIPAGITISPDRYWKICRLDKGESSINGEFQYQKNASYDANLISSENDSIVLLYRQNALEPWQNIAYEFQGLNNFGRMTVNNIQSGEYVLAAFDKNQIGINEINNNSIFNLYPNPTKDIINVEFNKETSGKIIITNQLGQTIKEIEINGKKISIDTDSLPSGMYNILIYDKSSSKASHSQSFVKH